MQYHFEIFCVIFSWHQSFHIVILKAIHLLLIMIAMMFTHYNFQGLDRI